MQKDIFNVLTSISTYAQTTAKKYSRLFHQGTRLHRKWNFPQVEQQFPVLVDGTEKVNYSQIFFFSSITSSRTVFEDSKSIKKKLWYSWREYLHL